MATLALFLSFEKHILNFIAEYGSLIYVILFLIIFCETGLVITPFLPGESLLFAVGAIAAFGAIDLNTIMVLLCIAAIAGDACNYAIGKHVGAPFFIQRGWIKKAHLEEAEKFYQRHGGMTIILARFAPMLRTFAPFVAGMAGMTYSRFSAFNVIGGLVWIITGLLAGYWFGNIPFVRDNFSIVIAAIVVVSLLPLVWAYWKNKQENNTQ